MDWILVGLGNPGPKYQMNRHNVGFMAIDLLLRSRGGPLLRESLKENALVSTFSLEKLKILCLKPQTYMNLSGDPVRFFMDFYKTPSERLVVLHDEIDLEFGSIKIQKNRGHGGHNGIRDISAKLSHGDYYRIRIGVGRPANPQLVANYVLEDFPKSDWDKLREVLELSIQGLESLVLEGPEKAMTQYNQKKKS